MKISKSEISILLSILFSLTLIFFVLAFLGFFLRPAVPHEFAMVIDVSSNEITFNLYTWMNSKRIKQTANIRRLPAHICKLSLSGSDKSDEELKKILYDCVAVLNSETTDFEFYNASIYIYGSEHTRSFCTKFPDACQNRFKILADVVESFGMVPAEGQVRPLNSSEESVYGWISANDFFSKLRDAKTQKLATLDLKNDNLLISSLYETSMEDKLPRNVELSQVRVYGKDYKVFSLSLDCFGLKEAQNKMLALLIDKTAPTFERLNSPCLEEGASYRLKTASLWSSCVEKPSGKKFKDYYNIVGKPDVKACQSLVEDTISSLDKGQGNILDGTKDWISQIDQTFYGFYKIALVSDKLRVEMNSSLANFNSVVEDLWKDHKNASYFFEGNYVSSLLTDKLGLGSKSVIIGSRAELIDTSMGSIVYNSKDIKRRTCGCYLGPVGMGSLLFTSCTFFFFGLFLYMKGRSYFKKSGKQPNEIN